MNSILERVRTVIETEKMSDSAFAKRIGITQSSFSSLFQRDVVPRSDLVASISNTFGISPGWLLTGEGSMFAAPPTIGGRLRRVRLEANHEVETFATLLSLECETYEQYEQNEEEPPDDVLDRVQTVFNVSAHWVRFGRGEKDTLKRSDTPTRVAEDRAEERTWTDRDAVEFVRALPDAYRLYDEYRKLKATRPNTAGCGLGADEERLIAVFSQLTPSHQAIILGTAESFALAEGREIDSDSKQERAG